MKYEYIIILLLVLICCLWSFQTCNHRDEVRTSQAVYDSLQVKIDGINYRIAIRDMKIDSIANKIDSLANKRKTNTAKKDAKIDTVRHASTVALDSIIGTIIARHTLLQ